MKKLHVISIFPAILCLLSLNCRFLNSPVESIEGPVEESVSKKTVIIATGFRENPIVADKNACYYLAFDRFKHQPDSPPGTVTIKKIDKLLNSTRTFTIETDFTTFRYSHLMGLIEDGDYLYIFSRENNHIFRLNKNGDGPLERIADFDYTLKDVSVKEDNVYVLFDGKQGLYCYNLINNTQKTITTSKVMWFHVDHNSLFWLTDRLPGSYDRTIWQLPHSSDIPVTRVTDNIFPGDIACSFNDLIYFLDAPDRLCRLSKKNGSVPQDLYVRATLSDEGYHPFLIIDNNLYIANHHGELWEIPLDANGTTGVEILLDQWGPYDSDDYKEFLLYDGTNLYRFAGADPYVRISDDDPGVLLKTPLH